MAAASCPACGAPVYANVYHKCGEPNRIGGPDGQIVEVETPVINADAGVFSEPPTVTATAARTNCDACGGPLYGDQPHHCDGNKRWYDEGGNAVAGPGYDAQGHLIHDEVTRVRNVPTQDHAVDVNHVPFEDAPTAGCQLCEEGSPHIHDPSMNGEPLPVFIANELDHVGEKLEAKSCNEILPGLFVGDWNAGLSFVGSVLNVRDDAPHGNQAAFVEMLVPVPPGHNERYCIDPSRLEQAADKIETLMGRGPPVLVHCAVGMERSPLAVAAWMVKYRGYASLSEAIKFIQAKRPIVKDRTAWIAITDVAPAPLSEREKYQKMWSHDQYRRVAPGEGAAMHFLGTAKPRFGSTIIDFGAGTGRGALMLAMLGRMKVKMVDFADNCLDDEVRQALTTQSHALSFQVADLSQTIPLTEEYGYCTDVMEHIPPEQVDQVLQNILASAQHVYFQISCTDDSCGVLIGHPLHLSVHEPNWWLAKFMALKCQVHFWKDEGHGCTAYVTAWSTGKEITEKGELNIEEEKIRENVRANSGDQVDAVTGEAFRWQQVRPYESNGREVMILGGGPSLNGQMDEIKRLQSEGCALVTLNGAYNWAQEKGLTISSTIVVDARPFNARFTHPVEPNPLTMYLIGSQCDPSVLEGLPRERTFLWNTTAEMIQDILEEHVGPGKWFGVVGGCTVLLRAIPLLRMLGYSKFHLFGCDSCVTGIPDDTPNAALLDYEHKHHAFCQPENDRIPVFPTIVGGRKFWCSAWQSAQAAEFIRLIEVMGNEFEIKVHGEGLLGWILQHGYDLDVEAEQNAAAAGA